MGGFRVRKSITVVPGVRLNVTKRGVGMTVGPKGLHYSVHSSGRRTVSARSGIPGVYYQSSHGGSRSLSSRSHPAAPARATGPLKPGLFAPKSEKQLFNAIKAQDAAQIEAVGQSFTEVRLAAFTLAGLMIAPTDGAKALSLLAQVFGLGDASNTAFFQRYVSGHVEVVIAEGVTAHAPLGRDAVGLTLAELYQRDGRLDEAIETVEQLEPTTYTAVSLAELYAQTGRFQDVIDLTEGLQNEDDATALLLVFRGVAFREMGFADVSHETFKEALRSRSRDAAIRHHALIERARNYEGQGKKAMARKDLERILAEDSDYPGLRGAPRRT